MKEIKQQFMAYRNGVIADTLRQAGWPHKVIFGLNLPQLTEIARTLSSPDLDLALRLWADREVRESRLLAPFLLPSDFGADQLLRLCADIRTHEEADLMAFRHIRFRADAADIAASTPDPYLREAISRFLE
ncbi:MAG: DNA alkylation repair protein [Lepagella sp.]|jgi:hypothetical protein